MNVYDKISINDCYGCGACKNICPFNAITMQVDSNGFYRSTIDRAKCNDCGLCMKACPRLNEEYVNNSNPECRAAWSSDEIRNTCSSGGLFTAIAIDFIKGGGYVSGAIWGDGFSAMHILTNKLDDLMLIRGSKYVQSELNDVYKRIKEVLDKKEKVLFSGTPCQVAGLYSYLNGRPDNLFTVDLICHGVSSSKILNKYLSDNYNSDDIEYINFRDKSVFGWSSEMNIYLKNDQQIHKRAKDDAFYDSFLSNISLNPTCESCQFSCLPRQGDISLGDFWNIEKYNFELNDGKGTSLLLVNNNKGASLVDSCKSIEKNEVVTLDFLHYTVNKTVFAPFKQHPSSKRFRDSFMNHEFNSLIKQCKSFHYDIGLVTTWFARNFGAIFTAFSLYKYLEMNGYSVLMLHKPMELWESDYFEGNRSTIAVDFGYRHYQISKIYSLENKPFIENLNDNCDCFMLGSDQLWNPKVYAKKEYFFLDFVNPNIKKLAYATSIGSSSFEGTDEEKRRVKYLLNRFSSISNREDEAVDILNNEFNISSARVVDPVFLIDPIIYNDMIKDSSRHEDHYIFAYILDGSEEKKNLIDKIAESCGLPIVCAYDLEHIEPSHSILGYDEANINCPEDWLWYIKNADYVITDSYHGTCFSIIFEKQFLSFANPERGEGRFKELLGRLCLLDRLKYINDTDFNPETIKSSIDYINAKMILKNEIEESKAWLKNSLISNAKEMTAEEYIFERFLKKKKAEDENRLRLYNDLNQLGCNNGCTCQELIDRMPENSYLQQVQGDYDPVIDTPLPFGIITIKKTTNYFVEIVFSQVTYRTKKPKMFIGNVVNSKLVGWTEFVTVDSLKNE